jgi:type IV pilus assembly protein PilX
MTLIGTAAMQVNSLEEKMTGNMRDKNLAFQAAESALRSAEATLNGPAALPPFVAAGTDGYYSENSPIPTQAAIYTDAFWTTNPVATSTINTLGNNIRPPQYIIQPLPAVCMTKCPPDPLTTYYRITVRATGATLNSVVILQSVFLPS